MTDLTTLHRSHAYRLSPTPEQAERLGQWVGAVRFLFNLALEQRRTFWRPGRKFDFVTQGYDVTALRAEVDWLRDVPRQSLDHALRDLDQAYRNWWAGHARAPSPRQRGVNDTLRLKGPLCAIRRTSRKAGRITLPKLGDVALRWDRAPRGKIVNVTITRRAGAWFAAVATEMARPATADGARPSVGIDRGVTIFAALSTGALIVGPSVGKRAAVALAQAQRRLARKVRGSQNYRKQRLRVARLQVRLGAARRDFLHKVSTDLAKSHGLVVLEDLNVRKMTASAAGTVEAPGRGVRQKAGLNRAILDQGWGMFRIMLAYKLEERGGHLLTVDPRYTSRTCSACGVVDADSREGTRFSCRSCGHQAHADTNAAINILRRGSPSMPVEDASAPGEAGTSRWIQ